MQDRRHIEDLLPVVFPLVCTSLFRISLPGRKSGSFQIRFLFCNYKLTYKSVIVNTFLIYFSIILYSFLSLMNILIIQPAQSISAALIFMFR